MRRLQGLLIAAAFAALTLAFWAHANRPTAEPPWPARIQGFAFSPYHADQDAVNGVEPSEAQIDADLALLAGRTNAVRTYSSLGTLSAVPRLADRHDINVALGAWIDARHERNEQELDAAIRLAREHMNVVRVIVGNEVVLRGDLPIDDMTAYLDRARAAIGQPVSTAEPWHVWLAHPELAAHVDFLAVHMLPYWEGVHVERAVDYTIERLRQLARAFPGKPIVVAEVGWPSQGRTRESAVATSSNEALFLRRFLARAGAEGYIYYLMEAFDQPWKAQSEGAVGAYWGVYDVERQAKFAFTAPIVRVPEWHALAAASVAVALLLLGVFYSHSDRLRNRGRSFLAVVVFPTATVLVWAVYRFTQQYLTASSVATGVLLFAGMLGVIAVLLAEALEWAEAHWVTARRRLSLPVADGAAGSDAPTLPKVSVHVPAYNEPPEMLIETLDALARLDYPDFEVLVIDNNTRDEAVWQPVEAHCARLGERFRFFHVAPLAGFKAGALNFALRHTAADAEVVAVIDSDYVVDPGWLRDLVPAFTDARIGFVQAPQDYRDAGESAFKAMAYAEYRGFFHLGMITRNERNAIIQHGTMTLVRRTLLQQAGAWAEWCITEDAELGLRLFEAGYEALYTPRSYGRGLMPDTFIDYRKQRFRWAYGAMQILRAHAACLFAGGPLSAGQRYHFVAGWLPWIADGFNVLYSLAALVWSTAMILAPEAVDPPLMMFSVLPLSLFVFKLMKLVHLYRARVGVNLRQTLAAALGGLALAHTIGIAILKGLVTRGEPFFRTPKRARSHALWQAFTSVREEAFMLLALWLAAWGVVHVPQTDGPDRLAWIVVLLVQSTPYAAAVLVSVASALPLPARWLGTGVVRCEGEDAARVTAAR
ncbi:MAG: glycosyltransferase [Gammaproteobacteria bacterium]|nr:glycosyltransferase [Gammaproteobacteria bacterium]